MLNRWIRLIWLANGTWFDGIENSNKYTRPRHRMTVQKPIDLRQSIALCSFGGLMWRCDQRWTHAQFGFILRIRRIPMNHIYTTPNLVVCYFVRIHILCLHYRIRVFVTTKPRTKIPRTNEIGFFFCSKLFVCISHSISLTDVFYCCCYCRCSSPYTSLLNNRNFPYWCRYHQPNRIHCCYSSVCCGGCCDLNCDWHRRFFFRLRNRSSADVFRIPCDCH